MSDIGLDREALALFEAFLDAEPLEPEAWLIDRAGGRPELLSRVRAFIAAETRISLKTGGAVASIAADDPPPTRLAGYAIIERIGVGGMGSVYLAKRDRGDFEHLAAIKIIRPGLLSERLVERFRRERQILAQLRHPNIAQLFDGGETEDGAPYIIMEYVEGLSLLAWVETIHPSRDDRIDKFMQVCAAVSFAHANLIVHRDITPSNVLVTAAGVAKLIDFGIARPAGAPGGSAPAMRGSSSLQTLSLTPGFAAPERMTGAEPTTAADIYSLGKLAQKLLSPADKEPEVAAIIARATAELPQHRYASVELLAADIAAWRDGYPVSAYRGGRGYPLRKFLGRHPRGAWATGIAATLLVVAFAVTAFAFFRADAARAAESRRFEDVRALANYLLFDLNDQLRKVPGNTTARADLTMKAQSYLDTLSKTSDTSPALQLDTARGLIRLAEIQGSPLQRNLGFTGEARANLDRANTILVSLQKTSGDSQEIATAQARIDAILSLLEVYKYTNVEKARAIHASGVAALDRVPLNSRNRAWRLAQRDLARAEIERYAANEGYGELVKAADRYDAMINAWPADERASEDASLEHAYALYNRGLAWSLMDREAEGYPAMRLAHDVFAEAQTKNPNDADLLYLIGWIGSDAYAAAARINKEVEAGDLLTSAQHAVDRLATIEDRDDSAQVLRYSVSEAHAQHLGNVGRFDEAIAEQQHIVDMRLTDEDETSSGADVAWSQMILGQIARQAGRRELACSSYVKAEERFSKADDAGRLIEFHKAFLPGLRAHIVRCQNGTPLSQFGPLRQ